MASINIPLKFNHWPTCNVFLVYTVNLLAVMTEYLPTAFDNLMLCTNCLHSTVLPSIHRNILHHIRLYKSCIYQFIYNLPSIHTNILQHIRLYNNCIYQFIYNIYFQSRQSNPDQRISSIQICFHSFYSEL